MAVPTALTRKTKRKSGGVLLLPFAVMTGLIGLALGFVAYILWPTWPEMPVAIDAPALPITVAGVLFEVPPAAIRAAVQRQPGPHERIDLAFLWPSLTPPVGAEQKVNNRIAVSASKAAPTIANERLFVSIAPLGSVLPPDERWRSVYPRYLERDATPGPDGLAVVPFRAGTPYEGEELIYAVTEPDRFFALCTRDDGPVPGICLLERLVDAAAITLRFPRQWLADWRAAAARFDRVIGQLHRR